MSVNDRSERDVTSDLRSWQIDWPAIERQLQTWISVALNQVKSKAACPAGQGATATQLAEIDDQVDAEEAVFDGPAVWRRDQASVYGLLTHQLRNRVRFVQRGGTLDDHDDVPRTSAQNCMPRRDRMETAKEVDRIRGL